jgi:hypothetical protein
VTENQDRIVALWFAIARGKAGREHSAGPLLPFRGRRTRQLYRQHSSAFVLRFGGADLREFLLDFLVFQKRQLDRHCQIVAQGFRQGSCETEAARASLRQQGTQLSLRDFVENPRALVARAQPRLQPATMGGQ